MPSTAEAFAQSVTSIRAPLPTHDYVDRHVLLKELRKPRRAPYEMPVDSGVIAARRIRELAWDLGQDLEHYRWISHASRQLGLSRQIMWYIVHDKCASVTTRTVDKVARKTSIPIAAFYDGRW